MWGLLLFCLLPPLGLLACALCCRPGRDLDQAALLPFADDPQAARLLERETGQRCAQVVSVPFEPLRAEPGHCLEA